MGRGTRHQPERLAEKLRDIRLALGLSQTEMLWRLGVEDFVSYHRISEYELGKREPLLIVLLQYARVAGVHMDDIVDDKIGLPVRLPKRSRK
jgi:transcriptional regulator with XRE-family HTH domain